MSRGVLVSGETFNMLYLVFYVFSGLVRVIYDDRGALRLRNNWKAFGNMLKRVS
jgi:hypothetical protein